MKRNLRRHRGKWIAFVALSLIVLVTLFGFLGPFRHHGHGTEWIEKKMNGIAEHVADELELRPEQRPAFGALTDGIKERVRNRIGQMRQTAGQLRDEFAADGIVLWVANAHEKSWQRIVSALSNAGAPIPPKFDSLAEAVDRFERLGTGAFETKDS